MVFTKKQDKRFINGIRYTDTNGINWNWHQIKISFLNKNLPVLIKTI